MNKEFDAGLMEQIDAQEQERIDFIQGLEPEELIDYLEDSQEAVRLVMEGISMSEKLTTGEGIILAALQRVNDAIDGAAIWIVTNITDENKKTASSLPVEKKKIVKKEKAKPVLSVAASDDEL